MMRQMRPVRLTTNVFGAFALKDDRIIEKVLFPKNASVVAKKLAQTSSSICDEEAQLIKKLLKTGVNGVAVKNTSRFWGHDLRIKFLEDREGVVDVFEIAGKIGINDTDARKLIFEVNSELTKQELKVIEHDRVLIQAVNSLDDLEEVANRLVERLREWYSLHFPELDHLVSKHETYAGLIDACGSRNNFDEKVNLDPEFRKKIINASKESLGAEFSDEDIKAVRNITKSLLQLYSAGTEIERYVKESMDDIAPNISALAGPLLGARLIALAGSLKRLSLMPAGTIQILGAEDAFFRFLKTKKKPPKHGIIFQLPEIRSARKEHRGKLARTFAAKLALAAKVDMFKGEFVGDKLREDFMKRVSRLK